MEEEEIRFLKHCIFIVVGFLLILSFSLFIAYLLSTDFSYLHHMEWWK